MSFSELSRRIPGAISRRFRAASRQTRARLSPRDPVTVFHHIPKCGGTSFRDVLGAHFLVVPDYRPDWDSPFPPKVSLDRLRGGHLLSGHFDLDGGYLHQRYPEVLESDRFRLFTVVREPLELRTSLYRFENKWGVCKSRSLEEHLFGEANWLANRFPIEEGHLSETLDRYEFIGTLDDSQLTLDVLTWKLGIPSSALMHVNKTRRDPGSIVGDLTPELIERFRAENPLDYALYEEARRRFAVLRESYRQATGR